MNNVNILYEDNHLLVVVKPVNMLSQSDITNDEDLLSILKVYIKEKYQKPGAAYLGLVHRLDRMTSGVMVFAKTSKCATRLNEQMNNNLWHKKYFALVEGKIDIDGSLSNYISKDEINLKAYISNESKGKLAKLNYHVIKSNDYCSLVDVELLSGRYHQIRIQFANIGHPLVGDTLYHAKEKKAIKLHAYYLSFLHPITKEKMEFVNYPKWKDEV